MKKRTHRLYCAKKPHQNQLHFGHYWEDLRNSQRQPQTLANNLSLQMKKKRPLWKDLMIFAGTTISVWGFSHLALNYAAFAEIANYKLQTTITNLQEKFKPKPLEKLVKVETSQQEVKFEKRNSAKKTFQEMIIYPADNRLVLPRIDKNVPLIKVDNNKNWKTLENTIQKGLQKGVVVHPVSRNPNEFGNFFLTGHSSYYAWDKGRYKDVFALLHELKSGDRAVVYWEGKKYTYLLEKSKIVPPTEVSVLKQPNDKSMITLMTCTPVGTNKNRLIWQGKLLSVE